MTCPSCSRDNRPSAKFCAECGAPLQSACPKCGCELPPDVKFCDECGAPVAGATQVTRPAEPAGARKIVTILFADLVGSTALHERLDPESARRFMESYYAAAREAVESHGGTVTQFLGDGAKAVFGVPRVAEDDAIRAVRAGVAMQEAFHALAEQQRGAVGETGLRVAVNTGEVVVKAETEIIGDPVNVAARLQERGRDGDVVIGESTRRLVASQVSLELLGSFDLKGRAEAVKAYRVVSLDAPGRAATTAFVGREEELARVTAVFDRAIEKPAAHLAVLLGSPGLGKSRLIGEFARRSGETATVIVARCDAAGGATFAPLAEALRELLDIEASQSAGAVRAAVEAALPAHGGASADPSAEAAAKAERARIAAGIAGILAGSPGAPEETFFMVRRFLAGLTTTRPVVLMIDDLQWAEPLLFDLVEHLVQWGRGLPLLVLVGARPELREVRSSFAMPGGLVADVVTLAGLDAGVAMRLAAGVIGATDLPAAVAAKVLATSEGNPLFIGELVRMLVDEGALIREGDRWTTGEALATVEMPPTIHALLAARIERLQPQQCAILERAAVVGRQFSRSAVAALLPSDGASLDAQLESLQRAQLIERDTGWLLGEPVLRFHHVLIRDAAYRRLLKGTRAELHERLANWIEERVGDAAEHDETIGRHLEEAHRLLGELGPIEAAGQRLGERAATRLAAAGRRALESDDVPLAAGLLGRALDRLGRDDPARADLALDWCEALLSAGDVSAAAKAIEELGRLAEDRGLGGYGVTGPGGGSDSSLTPNPLTPNTSRLQAWHTCFVGHRTVLTAPKELSATVEQVAAAATALASLNDAAGEAKGHFVHALALSRLGRVGACEASLDRALAAARRAGDRRRANTVLAIAPLAALWGPSPVTRASGRCLDVVRVLRITQGAPAVEAVALSCQGVLEALRGRTEAAHRMIASGRKMVEELGIAQRLFETDVSAGFVAMLEGDAPAAEQTLRGAYDGLRELGLGIDAARAAALLARALLAQDRSDEAEVLSHESEALAGDDLKAAIAWRGVRAEALARRGEHGEAFELAKAGVEIAAATDALLDHADARLALAAALRAAGRGTEADAEDRYAIELWEAKGATLLAERIQYRAIKPVRPDRSPLSSPVPSNVEGGNYREVDLPADEPPPFDAAQGRPGPLLGRDGRPERRVRPNAATRISEGFKRTINARDPAALERWLADDLQFEHWPTGASYGAREFMTTWRGAFKAKHLEFELEVIASLGDCVAVHRHQVTVEGVRDSAMADFGRAVFDEIVVVEADDSGKCRRMDLYAPEKLGDAIVRLYELHAAQQPEGPARTRLEATAQAISTINGPVGLERVTGAYAPDLRLADHRILATWSCESAAELKTNFRHQLELAPDFAARIDDVLVLETDALLVRVTYFGTIRDSGGAFENRICVLYRFGDDGRIAWIDCYEAEHEAEALARFDELTSDRPPLPRPVLSNVEGGDHRGIDAPPERGDVAAFFANSAVRAMRRVVVAQTARDIEAIAATFADDFRGSDRRSLLRADTTREEYLEAYRSIVEMTSEPPVATVMATRGARLALVRWLWRGAGGDVGPSEIEMVHVIEVDDRGDHVAVVTFDATDIDAAYAELDARFEAEQGDRLPASWKLLRRWIRAVADRDWNAVASLCADDFVEHDHRSLSLLGVTRGVEPWIQVLRTVSDLAPDSVFRIHHFIPGARGYYEEGGFCGTREGGPFEIVLNALVEIDDQGLLKRVDIYDDDRVFASSRWVELGIPVPSTARKSAELDAPEPTVAESNAAMERWLETYRIGFETGNWEPMREVCAPGVEYGDRRRMVLLEGDVELLLASVRERAATGARIDLTSVGTAGARVNIYRVLWSGGPADGRFEIEYLAVAELDESGLIAAFVLFDLDDARAAQREAWARWAAIDPDVAAVAVPMGELVDAFNAHDRGHWRAQLSDEIVVEDHRHASMGRIEGADAYADTLVALWALAPETTVEAGWYWPALDRHGAITLVRRKGRIPDGGEFESEYFNLYTVSGGRITHIELFEVEDLDRALASFEELRPLAPRLRTTDLPRIPPNAASCLVDRIYGTQTRAAVDALRDVVADDFRFEDRTTVSQLTGSADKWLGSLDFLWGESRARVEMRRIATAGDRLVLDHCTWRQVPGEAPFEIENHRITETDPAGRLRAVVLVGPEDRAAAHAELFERYVALGAEGMPQGAIEFLRGWNAHDLVRARGGLSDGFVLDDHRRTGMGRLEGADRYIESVAALHELIPDARIDRLYDVAVESHGRVFVLHTSGHNREGGEVESLLVVLMHHPGEKLSLVELFEAEHLDAALARFEELRP